jgi:membrane-associated protein
MTRQAAQGHNAVMESEASTTLAAPAPETAPARRGIHWKDVACVGPIILRSIYDYAGLPLNALLLGTHPILLSALRGSTASMIAAGGFARVGKASIAAALLAPVPVSMMTDPFFFWAGRRYGRKVLEYLERNDPRWRKRIARGERWFRKFGIWTVVFAAILPVPSAFFYMAAGEAGIRLWLFLAADLVGTLLFIGLYVGAGWLAGQHAVDVAQAITHYAWWFIGGTFVLIVAWSVWSALRAPATDG